MGGQSYGGLPTKRSDDLGEWDVFPRYVEHLPDLVAKGQVSMEEVDEGVRRILRVKKAIGYLKPKRGKSGK